MDSRSVIGSLIIAIISAKFLIWIVKFTKFHWTVNKIPGLKGWPFIGKAFDIARVKPEDRIEWFTKLTSDFKNGMFVVWVGSDALVRIRKPRQLEVVLPSITLISKGKGYDLIKPWLGNGLLTSTGQQWFHQRRLLTPAFHYGVLEKFLIVINEKVDILNECLEYAALKNPGKPLNIIDYVVKCTLDIICETSMGFNLNAQRNTENEYAAAVHKFSKITINRFIWPWAMWDWYFYSTKAGQQLKEAVKTLHDFTIKLINEKKRKRKISNISHDIDRDVNSTTTGIRNRKTFLDLLLEGRDKEEQPFTDKEIREQVDTFMFAGHDTTTAAISWCLFALGNEPKIQAKVREEVNKVLGDSTSPITANNLSDLKYTERVIKESLRLFPSVPFILRSVTHDVVIDGYTVPKGATLQIDILRLHRDPEIWDDPETFDPDRFLPHNVRGRHPYAYIPFSAGPRNCIGQKFALMELKATIAAVLRKWHIKSTHTSKDIKKVFDLILRPATPLTIQLTPVTPSS